MPNVSIRWVAHKTNEDESIGGMRKKINFYVASRLVLTREEVEHDEESLKVLCLSKRYRSAI